MKSIKKVISLILFQFVFLLVYSQSPSITTFNFEFKNNLNRTSHLNSPISINTYFEDGRILHQDAKWTNSHEIYLNLRKENCIEYRIGIVITKIRFNQTREDWTGIAPDFFEIVHEEIQYNFVNFLLGCRKYFKPVKRLRPLIGIILIYDRNIKNDFQVKYGFSSEFEIGIEYNLNENLLISSNLLYRNAILPYNRNKNYYPNLLGIGISLKYQMNTLHNML